jgi:hypothetical protein
MSFLQVSAIEGRIVLDKILENTPHTSVHDEFPKEEEESTQLINSLATYPLPQLINS